MNLVTKTIGRWFFALVGRRPIVFAAMALAGLIFGLFLVIDVGPDRPIIVGIGIMCIVFYTTLLAWLLIKLRLETWVAFCEWAESLFSLPGPATPINIVMQLNAQVRALPCPECNESLGDQRPGKRTFKQFLWGGWTCSQCGCDVDRHGAVRSN